MIFDIKKRKAAVCVMLAAVLSVCSGCGKRESNKNDSVKIDESTTTETTDNTGVSQDTDQKDSDDQEASDDNAKDSDNTDSTLIPSNELKEMGHYSNTVEGKNGRISVETDAQVRAMICDSYPVVRISTEYIDDDFLNKVKSLLLGDTELYDGIRMYNPIYDDYCGDKVEVDPRDQDQIEGKVPRSEITKYPVETKLFNIEGNADKYSDVPDYADYYMQLMHDGDLFYGVSDGKDGSYSSLSVTNTKIYGNSLKFFKSREYGIMDGLVMPGINTNFIWPVESGIGWICDENNFERELWPPTIQQDDSFINADGEKEQYTSCIDDPNFKEYLFRESDKETNNLSDCDALKQADDLLKQLGIADIYTVTSIDELYIADHATSTRKKNGDGTYSIELTVGKVWDIVYKPAVKGNVVEDYGEMVKYASTGLKESVWFNSEIEVMVNDNGIVGFSYVCPIKYDEITNEDAELLDLSEIKKIYEEKVLPTINESNQFYHILDDDSEYEYKYTIKIDDITLRYARMSDHESNDRGYLVPVWDFSGTAYDDINKKVVQTGSFIQINAIDGSVYNSIEGR